jgi:hypothetical protein
MSSRFSFGHIPKTSDENLKMVVGVFYVLIIITALFAISFNYPIIVVTNGIIFIKGKTVLKHK